MSFSIGCKKCKKCGNMYLAMSLFDRGLCAECEKAEEPSRDIEEIAEIMSCDADAETKCKMISNILNAKPHYFEKQESMCEFTEEEAKAYSKALDKMYKPTGLNVFNETSGDVISRQALLDIDFHRIMHTTAKPSEMIRQEIINLPSIKQEPKTGHWIEEDVFDGDVAYRCSECNELFWIESGTPKDNEYNFCPKCGAKMESEDKE